MVMFLIPKNGHHVAVALGIFADPFVGVNDKIAASARAAPVIMFFKNSMWPGASMMM